MNSLTRAQVEALAAFKSQGFLTTSFYLDTDKSRRTRKEIQLSLKNLLADARNRIQILDAGREKKESLTQDLEKIHAFMAEAAGPAKAPGLAAFACSRGGFFQTLELPHGPRDRAHFESVFYVRPLAAILDRYRRSCALVLGRREARWYEVYMGGIALIDRLESDTPQRMKSGAAPGDETRKNERHVEAKVLDHLKAAAQRTFALFKKDRFDWLFLGCEDNLFPELEPQLHAYLKERLRPGLKSRVNTAPARILAECQEMESRIRREDEETSVQRLIAELERGGLAASGLKDTLRRLNQYEVQSLIVSHSFSRAGRICPNHHYLFVDELTCPVCDRVTVPVADIVDEAIDTALTMNLPVKHIAPPSRLQRYGDIGAFLKYKMTA